MLSKQSTTQFCSLEKSLLFFSQFLLCQEIFTKTAFNLSKLALIGAYEEERIGADNILCTYVFAAFRSKSSAVRLWGI
jgi:hypothetical protein